MGKNRTIITSAETADRTTSARASHDIEWDFVDIAYWSALAGFARTIWKVDNGIQSFSTLAEERGMATGFIGTPIVGRSTRAVRLGNPLRGWDDCARPSTCCRGKKSTPEEEALGRSRGGLTTKIHVRAEGSGKMLTFLLTPGQQHDITVAEDLLEQGAVQRKGGQRRRLPKRLVADKGYSSHKFRTYLRNHRIGCTIPHKDNELHKGRFDPITYRLRNRVERLFARLKQFRRIATRYEKRASNFAAMITIASIFLWS